MNTTPIEETVIHNTGTDAKTQFLTFILGAEEYGVDILRVQEIKGWETVTPIPNVPVYILGVMNLRGTVVPIVDLRLRFAMDHVVYDDQKTVVIVLHIMENGKPRTIGMVVDAVSDVCHIEENELRAAPDFGGTINTQYIRGLAPLKDHMLIVLDIDHLITDGVLKHSQNDTKELDIGIPTT